MDSEFTKTAKIGLIEELEKLRDEIRKAADPLTEEQFWKKPLDNSNSVGHLVLHLTGNLSHFVGAQLGKTGYVRDREREFTESTPPSKAQALAGLDDAVAVFRRVVASLSEEDLINTPRHVKDSEFAFEVDVPGLMKTVKRLLHD